MRKIWCVFVSGHSMPAIFTDVLYVAAREMVQRGLQTLDLKSDAFEGRVTTKHETMLYVSISGYAFNAEIEWGTHQAKVLFIVRPGDLPPVEEIQWAVRPTFGEDRPQVN